MTMPPDLNLSSRYSSRSVRTLAHVHWATWGAVAGVLWAGGPVPSLAVESNIAMRVSANVLPEARLYVATAVLPVQVNEADVASGYVDAPLPLQLRVESNSRTGFVLDVSALSPWCTAVALQGFDSEVVLDGAGGAVVQRWLDGRSRALALRARFKLAPNVRPGLYAWPLRLSARPL